MKKAFRILLVLTMVGTLMTTGFAGAAAAHSSGHSGGDSGGGHHDGGHGGAADGAVDQNATAIVDQDQLVDQDNVVESVNATANAGEAEDGNGDGDGDDGGIQRVEFYRQPGNAQNPQLYAIFEWNSETQEFDRKFTRGQGNRLTLTAVNGGDGAPQQATWQYTGNTNQEPVYAIVDPGNCRTDFEAGQRSGTLTACEPTDGNNDEMNGDDDAQAAGNATVDVGIDQSNANTQQGEASASNVNADGQMADSGSSGAKTASGSSGGHHDGGHHHDDGGKDGGHGGADDGAVEQDATAIVDQAQEVGQSNYVGNVNATANGGNATVTVDIGQSNDNSQIGIASASNLNLGDSNEAEA